MIDTIVLRLHNLEKYDRTKNLLFAKNNTATTKFIIIEETGEVVTDNIATKVVYHDSDYVKPVHHRGSSFVPSSHYNLSYSINMERAQGFIEFNFSIPKYIWGTNLVQFIDYYNTSFDATYIRLMQFIDNFTRTSVFADVVDMRDLEINRIDLCYNQFFPSKVDALQYLEYQKQILKRFSLQHEERPSVRLTSLDIVTDRYSFKIYHKGTEFEKNDYKELVKNNPKNYDLQNLLDVSHRVLRYELTVRNSFMNYAFKRMYFDNGFAQRKSVYRYLYKAIRLDGHESLTLKQKQFHVKSEYDRWKEVKQYDPQGWEQMYRGIHAVTFDVHMFHYLYNYFWKWTYKFQVVNSISMDALETKVKSLNEVNRERNRLKVHYKESLKNEKRLMMYAVLSQSQSLHDLYRRGLLGKTTYFRIMKDFKKIGLSEYNPDIRTVKPDMGYQDYKSIFGYLH